MAQGLGFRVGLRRVGFNSSSATMKKGSQVLGRRPRARFDARKAQEVRPLGLHMPWEQHVEEVIQGPAVSRVLPKPSDRNAFSSRRNLLSRGHPVPARAWLTG